jgi:transposase
MNQERTQADALSQNRTPAPAVCWVGLDWADTKHCLAVRTAPGGAARTQMVEQKPATLEEFFLRLHAQHPQGPIAVGIEQSRGPVLYALLKFDFLVIYPINPRALADYRRAFNVSGAKDDPRDADLLCELVSRHADRLRPLVVEEVSTRTLRLLVEARRDFVDERTGLTNRLGATLKCYYPLALELVGEDLTTAMALAFLRRWPTLAKLQAAKPSTLRGFFYAHNSRSEEKITQRLEAIAQARPLTEDPALIQPLRSQMERLVHHVRTVNQTIDHYDRQIREVFAQHPQASLFRDLPGAGAALAPRLAAVFGTVRSNFPSAEDVLCLSGVAPVKKQSGTQKLVHFRYARPLFMHQSLVEFAKCSIGQCEWARLLYEHQLKKGKSKWMAIRVVAFKWVRILWRCWMDQVPYDELKYLRSLHQQGLQLYATLYATLPPLDTTAVNNSKKNV